MQYLAYLRASETLVQISFPQHLNHLANNVH
jgi:hypothetical protein